jgi:putative SOS response-associated peptidase YedK
MLDGAQGSARSMCGKFTRMMSWARLHHLADLTASAGEGMAGDELQMRTPMRFASVIRLDVNGQREAVAMRWGFADRRAKTPAASEELKAMLVTVEGDWDLSEQAKPQKRAARETAQSELFR